MNHSSNVAFSISPENQERGYGKFPYIIIRLYNAVYIQIPIHFSQELNDVQSGFHILTDTESESQIHFSELLKAVKKYRDEIVLSNEKQEAMANKKPTRMCLVLSSSTAYYFEENSISHNTSIPDGGSLFNSSHKMIAMNSSHFV